METLSSRTQVHDEQITALEVEVVNLKADLQNTKVEQTRLDGKLDDAKASSLQVD